MRFGPRSKTVKLGLTVAVLVGCAAAPAPPASALLVTAIQQAGATISPNVSGTATNPQPVDLTLTSSFDPSQIQAQIDAGNQFAPLDGLFALGREFTSNFTKFPSCSTAQVVVNEQLCPAGALVGTGTLVAVGLNLVENLDIKAFNRPNGYGLVLLVTNDVSAPVQLRVAVEMSLTDANNPALGQQLMFTVPSTLAYPVAGVLGSWQSFRLTIPSKATAIDGLNVPFIGTTGCAAGSWEVDTTATYTTKIPFDSTSVDSQQTVKAFVPCTPGSGPVAPPVDPGRGDTPPRPVETPVVLPTAVKTVNWPRISFVMRRAPKRLRRVGEFLGISATIPRGMTLTVSCTRSCNGRSGRLLTIEGRGSNTQKAMRRPLKLLPKTILRLGVIADDQNGRFKTYTFEPGRLAPAPVIRRAGCLRRGTVSQVIRCP